MIATLATPIKVIVNSNGRPAKIIALAESEDHRTYALIVTTNNQFEYLELHRITYDPDQS